MSVDRLVAGKPPRARTAGPAAIMHRRLYLAQLSTFHAYASAHASSALFYQRGVACTADAALTVGAIKVEHETHHSCRACPRHAAQGVKVPKCPRVPKFKVPKVSDYAIHSSAWSAGIVNQESKGKHCLRAFSVHCCSRNSFRQSFRSNFSLTRLADARPV